MCGIAGKLYFNPLQKVDLYDLKNMTDSIAHRGPDDEGHYIMNNVGLGFKRLSIIDIKKGPQPLSNFNKKIWITFNGEIYSFKTLKNDYKFKEVDLLEFEKPNFFKKLVLFIRRTITGYYPGTIKYLE